MNSRNFIAFLCIAAAVSAATVAAIRPANAQSYYNVQFNSTGADYYEFGNDPQYTGANEFGAGGDSWNYLNVDFGQSLTGLVSGSGGSPSTVDFSLTEDGAYSGDVNSYAATATPTSISTLLSQYALVSGSDVGSFSLTNLPTDTEYDLVLYSGNGAFNNSNSVFSVNGGTALTSTTAAAGADTNGDTSFVAGGNYVEFSGLTSASGGISGTYAGATGREGDWNGLSLELIPTTAPAPEASTVGLLGVLLALGTAATMWNSRKRASQSAK